jgi:hypothetical protein
MARMPANAWRMVLHTQVASLVHSGADVALVARLRISGGDGDDNVSNADAVCDAHRYWELAYATRRCSAV